MPEIVEIVLDGTLDATFDAEDPTMVLSAALDLSAFGAVDVNVDVDVTAPAMFITLELRVDWASVVILLSGVSASVSDALETRFDACSSKVLPAEDKRLVTADDGLSSAVVVASSFMLLAGPVGSAWAIGCKDFEVESWPGSLREFEGCGVVSTCSDCEPGPARLVGIACASLAAASTEDSTVGTAVSTTVFSASEDKMGDPCCIVSCRMTFSPPAPIISTSDSPSASSSPSSKCSPRFTSSWCLNSSIMVVP